MQSLGKVIAWAGALGFAAGAANAGMVFGLPVTMLEDNTTATAVFSGARASWTGMLYLDDPTAGLGTFLFNNKSAVVGDTRSLGVFNEGDSLGFNYRVVTGNKAILTSVGDSWHFGLEQLNATTVLLRIEDMPASISDKDWDDCVVTLRFSKAVTLGPINGGGDEGGTQPGGDTPTPGTLAVVVSALGLSGRRRRG